MKKKPLKFNLRNLRKLYPNDNRSLEAILNGRYGVLKVYFPC